MIRKFIRKRIQEQLKAAKITGVDQDVFSRKSTVHDDQGLPIINIYPNTESVQRFDEAPKRYKRSLDVVIEAVTTHDTDSELADELDFLSYEIEKAIESDKILQGINGSPEGYYFEDTELTSIQYDTQGDGSSPFGAVRLSYSVSYVDRPYTEIIYNNFETVDSQWEIGDHGDNKAQEQFEIPQE